MLPASMSRPTTFAAFGLESRIEKSRFGRGRRIRSHWIDRKALDLSPCKYSFLEEPGRMDGALVSPIGDTRLHLALERAEIPVDELVAGSEAAHAAQG